MSPIDISKESCVNAAAREGDHEIGAGHRAADPLPDIGVNIEQIVDLVRRSARADAIQLLQQTLVVARSAGFMDGMHHLDAVQKRTFDRVAAEGFDWRKNIPGVHGKPPAQG